MKTLQLWKILGKLVKRNNMQVPKKTQQACLIVEKSCPGIATWHKYYHKVKSRPSYSPCTHIHCTQEMYKITGNIDE